MKPEKRSFTRLDYCQYLVSSQINYTLTNLADHSEQFSHDRINRFLREDRVQPSALWEEVGGDVTPSPQGYLLFDDTVADKNYSHQIELVRRQYSGNAKAVIRGIGLVTCVYVNPELDQFWIIDYRLYDPTGDGKSKLDHVTEMLDHTLVHKKLPVRTVLMDSWYATRELMRHIEQHKLLYYCPVKANRQVDTGDGTVVQYQRVDALEWDAAQLAAGRSVHLKDFPKGHRLQLFRLAFSSERTEFVVTNDIAQDSAAGTRQECAVRWKIEQLHREVKQVTGIERCQCRKARIQRNHIGCSFLVWAFLNRVATQTHTTIYQLKAGLLSDYLRRELKNPTLKMTFA